MQPMFEIILTFVYITKHILYDWLNGFAHIFVCDFVFECFYSDSNILFHLSFSGHRVVFLAAQRYLLTKSSSTIFFAEVCESPMEF